MFDKFRCISLLQGAADPPKKDGSYLLKGRASEAGSGSCRSKADSKSHARNPLTETADKRRKTAAMVLPIHGGVHIEIRFPACISDSIADNSSRPYPLLFCHGFCCRKLGSVSIHYS